MKHTTLFATLGAGFCVLTALSCSGGDGGGSGVPSANTTSVTSSGTITGFGSLFVNGKKFETNGVEVRHDGVTERCSISQTNHCGLKEGMTVTVNGSFNGDQRSASTVQQSDAVEGLVQSIATDGLSLIVMGQTVFVDSTTLIDNSNGLNGNISNLDVGDFVEVNGHVRPNGVIQATFIEKKVVGVTPEVRGFVTGHDNNGSPKPFFFIGGLKVEYDNNPIIIGDMPIPNGSNWNGLFVEVKGTFNSATTTLTASKVEPENQGVGNVVDEFEVEGFVTQAGQASGNIIDFTIGTTSVRTTANTEFRGGTVDEIVVGAKMSAEGRFDGTTLIAKHVKFHESARLEGNVVGIVRGSAGVNEFKLVGLPTVTITVDSRTEFEDTSRLTLDNTNHVRVRGRVSGASSVIATRIELRQASEDVDLQGPVQSVNGQTLVILNTQVNTSGFQNDDFEGLNDQVIGSADFFNAVKVGTVVKVKGRLNNGVITWREVELED